MALAKSNGDSITDVARAYNNQNFPIELYSGLIQQFYPELSQKYKRKRHSTNITVFEDAERCIFELNSKLQRNLRETLNLKLHERTQKRKYRALNRRALRIYREDVPGTWRYPDHWLNSLGERMRYTTIDQTNILR